MKKTISKSKLIGKGSFGCVFRPGVYCRKKKKKSSKCKRCGRNSHYASNCYAETHVKGYYLNY